MNKEKLALAAGCAAFVAAVASAQTGPAPVPAAPGPMTPPYKNLQVLPKDISREQLLPIMKSFALGLGVRCQHCHVGVEGQPLSTFDFASDTKKEKLTARKMLVMVHRINEQDFGIKDYKDVKVTCFTCHRGATKPWTEAPLPPPPAAAPPPKATERG